jgi:hypothetical protein
MRCCKRTGEWAASGVQGVGSRSATLLTIRSNFAQPTTCRLHIPYVEAVCGGASRVGICPHDPNSGRFAAQQQTRLGPVLTASIFLVTPLASNIECGSPRGIVIGQHGENALAAYRPCDPFNQCTGCACNSGGVSDTGLRGEAAADRGAAAELILSRTSCSAASSLLVMSRVICSWPAASWAAI